MLAVRIYCDEASKARKKYTYIVAPLGVHIDMASIYVLVNKCRELSTTGYYYGNIQ